MRFKVFVLLLCSALLNACVANNGPRGFWKPNRYDRNSLAKGRWRTYYDNDSKQPFTTGKYRHGRPVGTFRYFAPTGSLDHSERYGRDGLCEVTYWHPSGKVARRGSAQWVTGKREPASIGTGPGRATTRAAKSRPSKPIPTAPSAAPKPTSLGKLTQVETHDKDGRVTRAETYKDGNLLKVETFENGRRTGSSLTL
ncbi:toxin-antitoxin system YwqK family antitoxin [Hymenobacter humi]|uniref:Toxin-antitoxin system YwqK family antitoxin n=1 Tax=Hymenobacter humi TaxID=1411620 RepID=A0ABW2TZH6_9BACT